jgi:hypothetical protein
MNRQPHIPTEQLEQYHKSSFVNEPAGAAPAAAPKAKPARKPAAKKKPATKKPVRK